MLDSFDQLIAWLEARLDRPLPGEAAQRELAPATREEPDFDVEEPDCREAAVLVLLYPRDGRPHLALTLRGEAVEDHAGQISFPGGRREGEESYVETALREAREEVGLDPSAARVLGHLSALYIPPTAYCVYPVIAVLTSRPDWRPDHREVAEVIEVPVEEFLRAEQPARETWEIRGQSVEVPYFKFENHQVWGATSMMLSELLTLLREAKDASSPGEA